MHQKHILFPILFSLSSLSMAQGLESKIDSLTGAVFDTGQNPGAVFLVSKNGVPVYKKAFGMADLELRVPMTVDNVFQIGSMTKQFTAMAILMLEEGGQLDVADPISKYIPDYPNGDRITIHQLLTHTSGIKDFTAIKGLNAIAKEELSPLDLIGFFKNEPVDFPPGERFAYCNSGYILLGFIIETVAGESYSDFVEKHIFAKLNMHKTQYASHQKVIPNRASGYSLKGDTHTNNRYISFSIPFSSGSLMSSVEDMLKWQEAIKKHLLIGEEETKKAFANYKSSDGESINYGYGWHIETLQDLTIYAHGGSIFGFKSMAIYIPDEDTYVIGLTNCDCNSPTQTVRDIATLLIKDYSD